MKKQYQQPAVAAIVSVPSLFSVYLVHSYVHNWWPWTKTLDLKGTGLVCHNLNDLGFHDSMQSVSSVYEHIDNSQLGLYVKDAIAKVVIETAELAGQSIDTLASQPISDFVRTHTTHYAVCNPQDWWLNQLLDNSTGYIIPAIAGIIGISTVNKYGPGNTLKFTIQGLKELVQAYYDPVKKLTEAKLFAHATV